MTPGISERNQGARPDPSIKRPMGYEESGRNKETRRMTIPCLLRKENQIRKTQTLKKEMCVRERGKRSETHTPNSVCIRLWRMFVRCFVFVN